MSFLSSVIESGNLDRAKEDFSNEMLTVVSTTLMVQAYLKDSRVNKPFQEWSYEEIRDMFIK